MNWTNEDERAIFANYVCRQHLEIYKFDVYEAAVNLRNIYKMFHDNVRNIYELTTEQLPLFALHELIQSNNLDDWCDSVLAKPKEDVVLDLVFDCNIFYNEITL
jgi:hypothetical protein